MHKALLLPSVWHKNQTWHALVIPAFRRWRWEDPKFKVILGYIASLKLN